MSTKPEVIATPQTTITKVIAEEPTNNEVIAVPSSAITKTLAVELLKEKVIATSRSAISKVIAGNSRKREVIVLHNLNTRLSDQNYQAFHATRKRLNKRSNEDTIVALLRIAEAVLNGRLRPVDPYTGTLRPKHNPHASIPQGP